MAWVTIYFTTNDHGGSSTSPTPQLALFIYPCCIKVVPDAVNIVVEVRVLTWVPTEWLSVLATISNASEYKLVTSTIVRLVAGLAPGSMLIFSPFGGSGRKQNPLIIKEARMRKTIAAFGLAVACMLVPMTSAFAEDDGGGMSVPIPTPTPSCGTHEWHGEQLMTKGRTDGVVYSVDQTIGCGHLIYSNLSPAGRGEAQGNEGQMQRADMYAREDAVRAFKWLWGIEVDPSEIHVTTHPYKGAD
jgi:hypothetical protein